MQGELDKEVSKAGGAMAGTELASVKRERQPAFAIQNGEMEKYASQLRSDAERRLNEAEARLTREYRAKIFPLSFAIVVSAAGAILIGSFAATRDVSNTVIALQKDVIAAQTALKAASDDLVEQRQTLADAETGF